MKTPPLSFFVILFMLVTIGCSAPSDTAAPPPVAADPLPRDIDAQTAAQLATHDDVLIVDVRTLPEYEGRHIPDVLHLPMDEIASRLDELPADKTLIIQCEVGGRSDRVTDFLAQNGYENVHNLIGGIQSWEKAGLTVESGAADSQ